MLKDCFEKKTPNVYTCTCVFAISAYSQSNWLTFLTKSIEISGEWRNAMVVEVDCSLVKLDFCGLNHVEWLYRGNKRLEPLYRKVCFHPRYETRTLRLRSFSDRRFEIGHSGNGKRKVGKRTFFVWQKILVCR